jgi:hypothetical protein
MKITFDELNKINGLNLIDYWKDSGQSIEDFYCKSCGKFMLDLDDLIDVGYNKDNKTRLLRLYRKLKNKQYVESEQNRWLVTGRFLSGKHYFRRICWDCFFKELGNIEDIPRRARKSSWYKDILNGNYRPPASWTSPSKYFKILFDITDEELEVEHNKFDTASLESFKRRYGEQRGLIEYNKYIQRQAYTCSKEYMMKEKGMSEKEWNEFNANRACTKNNFIKRYGKELGSKKWDEYCELESYAGCRVEYFIEKYGREDGIKKYNNLCIQKSNSLSAFIMKYGDEGEQKYKEFYTGRPKKRYSAASQLLFNKIQEKLGEIGNNAKYGDYEELINIDFGDGIPHVTFPDYLLGNKIIEFNGDYWHMNPKKYSANDEIVSIDGIYRRNVGNKATDIWKYDEMKLNGYKQLGYDVKVVWESEYHENPEKIIQECIDFLKK